MKVILITSKKEAKLTSYQKKTLYKLGLTNIDIVNSDNSNESKTLLEVHPDDGDIVYIKKGTIIQDWLIRKLKNMDNQTIITSREPINFNDNLEPVIEVKNHLVASEGISRNYTKYYTQFYGIIKLSQSILIDFKKIKKKYPELSMVKILEKLSKKHIITVINVSNSNNLKDKVIIGGSFAQKNVQRIFHKEAEGLGFKKVNDEVTFLEKLPNSLAKYYPQIIRKSKKNNKIMMDQEYIEYPTLRDLLFNNVINAKDAIAIIHKVLSVVTNKNYFYTAEIPDNYLYQIHFSRVWDRMRYFIETASIMKNFVYAKHIELNGKLFWNLPAIILFFESSKKFKRLLTPNKISQYTHGDIHFENILVDPQTLDFKLVDPRGYPYCDIYYDLGKIHHCVHGKYDFIHESRYFLKWRDADDIIKASLKFPLSKALLTYNNIEKEIVDLYPQYTDDNDALCKVLLNEAIHFSSVMQFHLKKDNKEDKAIAFYLTAVKLLNEFIEKYAPDFEGEYWTTKSSKKIV